jgi:protein arginine N-methyltransferase 1
MSATSATSSAATAASPANAPAAAAAAKHQDAAVGAAPTVGAGSPTGDYYFDSYSHYGIHMEMLKDAHRTGSYRDAILMNPHVFRGKTVLDVGCGTGILSMFAAKAGAAKVIAIDCSSIAKQAADIVALNGFGDTIRVIKGRLEELSLPELEGKVDIIISEWMGYFLVYESMLQSVLFARDKFGAPGVKLFPSHANMFISGIHDPQYIRDRFDAWNNVEGFDFSFCRRLCFIEPLVDTVSADQIATTCERLVGFDLATVTEPELSFERRVRLTATRDDTVHALEVHFNTPFDAGHERVVLETAPWSQVTHWRQSVLYLINFLKLAKGDHVDITLSCSPNKLNPRDLDIQVRIDLDGTFQSSHFVQDFRMR